VPVLLLLLLLLPLLLLALLILQLVCKVLLLLLMLTFPVLLGREAEQAQVRPHVQRMCEHTGLKQQLLLCCAVLAS
jgi:hypothetical protein